MGAALQTAGAAELAAELTCCACSSVCGLVGEYLFGFSLAVLQKIKQIISNCPASDCFSSSIKQLLFTRRVKFNYKTKQMLSTLLGSFY